MFESILCQVTEYDPAVLESLIELAVEIAREGREGRRIGTLFTLGDEQAVLEKSRLLILDPLAGHPESARQISDPNLRGTIKELAQLDGGFIVSHDGIVYEKDFGPNTLMIFQNLDRYNPDKTWRETDDEL